MTEKQTPHATEAEHTPLGALAGEVDESLHPLLQAVVDNVKLIVGVIAALIVIVGGYAVYDAMQASNLAEGQEKLAVIVADKDTAKRAEALEAFAAEAPGAMNTAVQLELAAALSLSGEHERAAAVWQTLSTVDTADMGIVSALGNAAELARAGKHADAAAALSALRGKTPEGYTSLILHRLAYETELAGDLSAALDAWQELLKANESTDSAFIQSKIAHLRAKLEPVS